MTTELQKRTAMYVWQAPDREVCAAKVAPIFDMWERVIQVNPFMTIEKRESEMAALEKAREEAISDIMEWWQKIYESQAAEALRELYVAKWGLGKTTEA